MRNERGGILFDFFLICVILAGGAALWFGRSRWMPQVASLRKAVSVPLHGRGTANRETPAETRAVDLSKRSAEVQATVRELLSRQGIDDKDVLKTYAVERAEKDARWVEATIEVAPATPLHSGKFLKRLAPSLAARGLSILKDESRDGRWILEIGRDGKIFQRLVLHPAGP